MDLQRRDHGTDPPLFDAVADEGASATALSRLEVALYDAAYLELAVRNSLPLATLNGELRAAATAVGVRLLGRD